MNEDTHSELREMIGLHVIDQLEDADRDARSRIRKSARPASSKKLNCAASSPY